MAYQGWNRDGMLAAGSVQDPLNPIHDTISSFTPINHDRTPLPPSSPLDPVGKGLDCDSLYELCDDTVSEIPTKVSKKRKPLPSGRVVSLGRVWEYEDEEDIHNNGAAFQDSLPKRKKTTTSKRTQSMRVPPMNNARWKDDDVAATNRDGGLHEDPASQLITPPDSGKRKKGKSGPLAPKSKTKHIPLFKNPTITKRLNAQEKGPAPQRSNSIISHQGWKSTEESVQSTLVVLAKTTMEKLASFRFKPSSGSSTVDAPHLRKVASEMIANELTHQPLQETAHSSSHYDLPTEDSFFDEALWAVKTHTIFNSNDHTQVNLPVEQSSLQVSTKKDLEPKQPTLGMPQSGEGDSSKVLANGRPVSAAYPLPSSTHPMKLGEPTADPYDPTSSDSRAFDHLSAVELNMENPVHSVANFVNSLSGTSVELQNQLKDPGSTREKPHSVADKLQSSVDQVVPVCNSDLALGVESGRLCESPTDLRNGRGTQESVVPQVPPIGLDAPSSQQNDHDELPKQKHTQTTRSVAGYRADVQAERSDIDEPEMASNEESKDLWGSNEFDQGLDDDDLLAFASDATIPQTSMKAQLERQRNPRVCRRLLLPATPETRIPGPQNPATESIINPIFMSPQASPDLDEYPMDDEDEAEMLQMSELGAGVKENFAPPESVQKAYDDLVNEEVYDSSLQYSPPKSQKSGPLPSRVAQSHHTDKSRAGHSPSRRKDSLPVGEEEDWSFIRSDAGAQAETMSDLFYDPQAGATRTAKQCETLLSTLSRRGIADQDSLQTPTTQKTVDASWSIIDDSHEYEPVSPFARPGFPTLVLDHSPVVGFSPQTFLRTCFRVGEMFKEGVHRASLNQDAVIELFARVTFSSRETGSTKQNFQFADLWHDRPPYPNGLLANYKTTGLAESESKVFVSENGKMARCLGRFKRDLKNSTWLLHIINIRETDWEEIRWTKEIVSHGQVKAETVWVLRNL